MPAKTIKVLIIDDSALVRQILSKVFAQDQAFEVVGTAIDPLFAIKKIKEHKPDVITLDLEMPRMDGLTFLEKLMSIYPMPVVVISSLAQEGSAATLKALELGAVDYIPKPAAGLGQGLAGISEEIISKVKNAASVNMDEMRRQVKRTRAKRPADAPQAEPVEPSVEKKPLVRSTDRIIAIGASTGGTVAVKNILQKLPANLPGILVVLHMPASFTTSFASSLNSSCRMNVKEAEDGESVMAGYAYIAPGGRHMLLKRKTEGYYIKIDNSEPVNRHKPSVDKTFQSVAESASPSGLGVILTGMGDDGARGLKEMHSKGSLTLAQDEKTSIVFGMPKKAIELGGVDQVLSLDKISEAIVTYVKG